MPEIHTYAQEHTVLMAIFQVGLGQPAAPLILNLLSILTRQAKILHTLLFELGSWGWTQGTFGDTRPLSCQRVLKQTFLQAVYPSCHPTNSVTAPKAQI